MKFSIKERNCTCTFLSYAMRIQPGEDDRMFGHLRRGFIQILGLLCPLYSAEVLVCLIDYIIVKSICVNGAMTNISWLHGKLLGLVICPRGC